MDKTTRPLTATSTATHTTQPQGPAIGSPKQRAMADLASSSGGGMQMARSLMASATAGGGDPLPHRAQLESSLGMDLSFVTVHTGQEAVLQALGAEGAAHGTHILLGRSPSLATIAEEVVHAIQAGPSAAPTGAVSSPTDPAEQEARSAAQTIARGGTVLPGAIGQTSMQDAIHRSIAPATTAAEDVGSDRMLDASVSDLADELLVAIHMQDMPTLYATLGGDNRAVKAAFQAINGGMTVEDCIRATLPAHLQVHAMAFARYGQADIKSRIQAITFDISGTDEEALYTLLERATMEERIEVANDPTILTYILNDTSRAVEARCMALLLPVIEAVRLPEDGRAAALAALASEEATLQGGVEQLLVRLDVRLRLFRNDADGIISDVTAWSLQRGAIDHLDAAERTPSVMAPVLDWLEAALYESDFLRAVALLKSGGTADLETEIASADAWLTDWVRRKDEEAIFAALAEASPEERAALRDDEERRIDLLARLSAADQQRALALLDTKADGEDASALNRLLAALDAWVWISDAEIYAALEEMSTNELSRICGNDKLRGRIEAGVSDVSRFHDLIGYSADAGPEAGGVLAADNERLAARIEVACAVPLDVDEDLIYRAVLEWQEAGGKMGEADEETLSLIRRSMRPLDVARRKEVLAAVHGEAPLTMLDRLESTASGLWTDDTGLEATLEDVTDEQLVREWSNLSAYKALAEGVCTEAQLEALAGFAVDIAPQVKKLLRSERSDWLDLLGTLRSRLIAALRGPLSSMARDAFHYVPSQEILVRLQYAQNRATYAHAREETFWNDISMGLMDMGSASGPNLDRAMGVYTGRAYEAVQAEDGSMDELHGVALTEQADEAYLEAHSEYQAAKEAASQIAGGIAEVVVALLVTVVSGGVGVGAVYAGFISGVSGAIAQEIAESVIQNNAYDSSQGAEDLLVALSSGLVTAFVGPIAEKLAGVASASVGSLLLERLPAGMLQNALSEVGEAQLGKLLEFGMVDFPAAYAEELIRTEGVLRQACAGVTSLIPSKGWTLAENVLTATAVSVSDRASGWKGKLDQLELDGAWDEHLETVVTKGIVDIGIATTVSIVCAGEALDTQGAVELLCAAVAKLRDGVSGALEKRTTHTQALAFFNQSSEGELLQIDGMDRALALEIISSRGAGGYPSLAELSQVPGLKRKVLETLAGEMGQHIQTIKK